MTCLEIYYSISGTLMMEPLLEHCSVKIALDLISSLGPSLGFYINFAKCEVFGKEDLSVFPCEITKRSHTPHLETFGAPIGNEIFCNNFLAHKQSNVSFLLH